MDSKAILALLPLACIALPLAGAGGSALALEAPPEAVAAQGAAAPNGRPSIWGGVDLALYNVELAFRPEDGVVLQGLSVERNPPGSSETDVLVRIHAECSGVDGQTSDEVRARLFKRLQWELGVRSCTATYDLTSQERAEGVSPPVLELELDLLGVEARPLESDPGMEVQTRIRVAASSRSTQLGGIDIAGMEDRFLVRPQRKDRGFRLANIRAFVRSLEATPGVEDVRALRLRRAGEAPSSQLWSWELEVARDPGGR